MDYYKFSLGLRKTLIAFYAVVTLIALLALLVVALFGDFDAQSVIYLLLIVFIDIILVLFYFVLPVISVKKGKNVGTVVEYVFEDEQIRMSAKNEYVDEQMTVKYGAIQKIAKRGCDIYLFPSSHVAYIVDVSQLSGRDYVALKSKLESIVPQRKFKWE